MKAKAKRWLANAQREVTQPVEASRAATLWKRDQSSLLCILPLCNMRIFGLGAESACLPLHVTCLNADT